MKCSTRVKLAVVGAVLAAVFLAGAAWAGETEVVAAINNYVGLTASGNGSGTITVTGTKTNATTTLNLGDISGLTINWQAQVTGDVNTFAPAPEGDHIQLITIFGTGTFNIQSGALLKVSGTENHLRHVYLLRVLDPAGSPATINVNGGTLEALMPNATAIDRDSDLPPKININGGTINVPGGFAAVGNVTVNSAANVTGTVIKQPGGQQWSGTWSNWFIELYGACSVRTIFEDDEANEKTIENVSWHIMPGATATLETGAAWNIRKSWTLQNNGVLDIYGTLINFDQFNNDGVINNYSGNTLDNRGTLTTSGTINNKATGKMTNTGNIANTGTINNTEGGSFESVQTKEEMGGTIDGDVKPTGGNGNGDGGNGGDGSGNGDGGNGNGDGSGTGSGGSSSGIAGCNAGFGLIALALAGLAMLKRRA